MSHKTLASISAELSAERRRALSEETESFFSTASKGQALIAVQAICRRYPDLSASCKAMIDGLSASENEGRRF